MDEREPEGTGHRRGHDPEADGDPGHRHERDRVGRGQPTDEPLRGLAAPGPSKVGIEAAMRARDVSRSDVAGREGSQPMSSES